MNDSPSHPKAPTAPAAATPPPTAPAAVSTRRRNLKILAGVVAICAVVYASYWYLYSRYLESTDDCYVDGDVVQITAQIPINAAASFLTIEGIMSSPQFICLFRSERQSEGYCSHRPLLSELQKLDQRRWERK